MEAVRHAPSDLQLLQAWRMALDRLAAAYEDLLRTATGLSACLDMAEPRSSGQPDGTTTDPALPQGWTEWVAAQQGAFTDVQAAQTRMVQLKAVFLRSIGWPQGEEVTLTKLRARFEHSPGYAAHLHELERLEGRTHQLASLLRQISELNAQNEERLRLAQTATARTTQALQRSRRSFQSYGESFTPPVTARFFDGLR